MTLNFFPQKFLNFQGELALPDSEALPWDLTAVPFEVRQVLCAESARPGVYQLLLKCLYMKARCRSQPNTQGTA